MIAVCQVTNTYLANVTMKTLLVLRVWKWQKEISEKWKVELLRREE